MARLTFYGVAVSGSVAVGTVADVGLPFSGLALSGSLPVSTLVDVGLPFSGSALSGSVAVSDLGDEFIINIELFEGVAISGSVATAALFTDFAPSSFVVTHLPAGEISGSGSEEAQLGGGGSVAGQIIQDWENN